ncbi:hypothetical protein I7I48_07594 [Histoplasma ohiense]|nr:hypothetical protein I7I48_07594 [Histoplasma ohiense (nom. inval.)]
MYVQINAFSTSQQRECRRHHWASAWPQTRSYYGDDISSVHKTIMCPGDAQFETTLLCSSTNTYIPVFQALANPAFPSYVPKGRQGRTNIPTDIGRRLMRCLEGV